MAYAAIPPGHGEMNGATGEPGRGRGHRAMLCACGRKKESKKSQSVPRSSASRTTLAACGPGLTEMERD